MDAEYELRGFYRPSFFSLFINGEFFGDFSKMTQIDLGTFVHEYIHYLQNVTTIFGLRNSLFYFNYLYWVKKHIVDSKTIKLPLTDISFSSAIKRGISLFRSYNGSNEVISPEFDDVKVYVEELKEEEFIYKQVFFDLFLNGKKIKTLRFGNKYVKEGMAYLYQQLFDENVTKPTFPYLSVEILSKIINPDILTDKRKLIALCLMALNSQNCGLTLYELLLKARRDSILDGIEICNKYSSELIIHNNAQEISVQEFLLTSIDKFKEALSSSLVAKLNYFELLLNNVRLSVENNVLPIIEVLYDDEKSKIDKLKSLIDFYGVPHIWTIHGYNFFPNDNELNQPAMEYVELIGQRIVLDRLLGIGQDKYGNTCSLYTQCELSENDIIDDNCFGTQWKREILCPFKVVSDNWKLNEKIS